MIREKIVIVCIPHTKCGKRYLGVDIVNIKSGYILGCLYHRDKKAVSFLILFSFKRGWLVRVLCQNNKVYHLAITVGVLSTKYGWLSRKLKEKNPVLIKRKQKLVNLLCNLRDSVEKDIASILVSVYKGDIISLLVILRESVPHYKYETWSVIVCGFFSELTRINVLVLTQDKTIHCCILVWNFIVDTEFLVI